MTAGQFQRIGQKVIDKINSTETALTELNNLFEMSKMVTDTLTPAALNWRVSKWLTTGVFLMNHNSSKKYTDIQTPTLIIVGSNDRLLPSQREGRRLLDIMRNYTKVEVLEFADTGRDSS